MCFASTLITHDKNEKRGHQKRNDKDLPPTRTARSHMENIIAAFLLLLCETDFTYSVLVGSVQSPPSLSCCR